MEKELLEAKLKAYISVHETGDRCWYIKDRIKFYANKWYEETGEFYHHVRHDIKED